VLDGLCAAPNALSVPTFHPATGITNTRIHLSAS
jgi:hypothetical protein